jgi:hypothetical protein
MSDSSEQLLQKLCDLQQQQIDRLAEIAIETRKNYESYKEQSEAYEQTLRAYREREERFLRLAYWRGLIIAVGLALVAFAIIIARFL